MQVIAPGEPRVFEADGLTCRFVKPPRGFTGPAAPETDGVTSVDRLGMEVRVTTLARTVADLFDRHDLAGGAEELFNSLDLVARVDAVALVRHARARGNAAAAGAMGFWLERERGAAWRAARSTRGSPGARALPAALCAGRKTRVGKDGERLERHRSGRRCRTRLRGALNGAAHRPDTAAARRGDGIPTGYAGEGAAAPGAAGRDRARPGAFAASRAEGRNGAQCLLPRSRPSSRWIST